MPHCASNLSEPTETTMSETSRKKTQLIAEEAVEWLLAFEDETSAQSDQLRVEFVQWLKSSPDHVKEFLYASNVFNEIQNNDTLSFIQQSIVEHGSNVVPIDEFTVKPPEPQQQTTQAKSRWQLSAAAATLATLFLLGWLLLVPGNEAQQEIYATDIGEQNTVLLSDGTSVKLNTDTKIRLNYSAEFRKVELIKGEAIFDVAKDRSRPFKVNAGQTVAEALGTSFNVYRQHEKTIITVMEGIVKVTGNSDKTKAQLSTPDQPIKPPYHALTSGDQVTVKHTGEINELALVDPESVIAWTTQRLVFEGATLETVINEMNRYNHSKIILNNPQLKQRKISGVFSTNDPEVLLGFLSKVGGIIIVPQANDQGWSLSLPTNG